jgi:2-oxoisovalerate dehydrogenase E1 component beta subunit
MATLAQGVRLALHYAEQHLGLEDVFGQDVGPPLGGVFTVTQGLRSAWSTPRDERGILGTAAGLAARGVRSVCEIQFGDSILNSVDLLRLIGNTRWSTAGQVALPLVLMTPVGGGIRAGIYHSHSIESLLCHLPGWKVVMPANALDAYGLMLSAITDNNPVAVLLPKALVYRGNARLPEEPDDLAARVQMPVGAGEQWQPRWPDLPPVYTPIGPAVRHREGSEVSVVTWGRMLGVVQDALADVDGVDLLELRTLAPLDYDAIVDSVERTGKLLVVNEDREVVNLGEHILRVVTERSGKLEAKLVAARAVPGIGLAEGLEAWTLPDAGRIQAACSALCG